MLKPIPAAEIDLDGKALEVRYKENPGEPNLLTVDILAHQIDGTPADVRRSELALVALQERMTRDAMHERVEVEAGRRGIERVAWIEEIDPRSDQGAGLHDHSASQSVPYRTRSGK